MPEPNPKFRAKAIVKAILPKGLVRFIANCRYRGYSAHLIYVLKLSKYRREFSMANASVSDSVIVLPSDCRISIPSDIRFAFEPFGWQDPDGVDEFRGFMKAAAGRQMLWDIGALYGVFSLAFTLTGKNRCSLAFEPNPVSRAKLEECLRLNPTAKVQVYDFALGLPGKLVEFEETGLHYTAVAGLRSRPDGRDVIRRETVSIDQLVEEHLDVPDMIKIDVEGHEFEVLRGAENLLASKKPVLAIELHPELLGQKGLSALEIVEYLEKVGYRFFSTSHKPMKRSSFKRKDNFRVIAM